MKKAKLISFAVFLIILFSISRCFKTGNVESPKTKVELAKIKTDSLKEIRAKKIDFALTTLKEMIKKGMKNPDSYEMIDRVYNVKDTGNIVKLGIRFRGENSFGGNAITSVNANYNVEKDIVEITKQVNE